MGFSDDIAAFAKKAEGNADIVIRKTMVDIGKSLVDRTPVGDPTKWERPESAPPGYVGGHARANWQHSTGTLKTNEFDDIDGKRWDEHNVSEMRIQESLAATIKKKDQVHFMSNSVPYILALEDGHSRKQAPKGMAALTKIQFKDYIRIHVGEVNK